MIAFSLSQPASQSAFLVFNRTVEHVVGVSWRDGGRQEEVKSRRWDVEFFPKQITFASFYHVGSQLISWAHIWRLLLYFNLCSLVTPLLLHSYCLLLLSSLPCYFFSSPSPIIIIIIFIIRTMLLTGYKEYKKQKSLILLTPEEKNWHWTCLNGKSWGLVG